MAESAVDRDALRDELRAKYRDVAEHPDAEHHFHTGRTLAALLGYDDEIVARMPDRAVESFAGVEIHSRFGGCIPASGLWMLGRRSAFGYQACADRCAVGCGGMAASR